MMLLSEKERKVTIHNTSVLVARSEDKVQSTVSCAKKLNSTISAIPLDWLAYEELSRLYYSVQIRSVTVLSSVAVALVGGSCLSYDHSCLRLKSSRQRKGKVRIMYLLMILNLYQNFSTNHISCLLYTSPSPRDKRQSRMPSSA